MICRAKSLFIAWATAIIAVIVFAVYSCTVNPSKLDEDYVEKFANRVRCAKGYKGKCWCFVASRRTASTSSSGIGMALAPDELCR